MKHTMKMTAASLLMLIATLGSCVKGDKGDTGAPGTNGTNGTNGNANVHSNTITIPGSAWTYNSDAWEYSTSLTYGEITADVVTNGTVSVFIGNGTDWTALPFTYYPNTTLSYVYNFTFYVGGLTLYIDMSNTSTFTSVATNTFKVVAIGGSVRLAHPKTNWKDYNEVMAVINESNQPKNN